MSIQIDAPRPNLPGNYTELVKVEYEYTGVKSNFGGQTTATEYTTFIGDYELGSQYVDANPDANGNDQPLPAQTSNFQFYAPKDNGSYDVTITSYVRKVSYSTFPPTVTVEAFVDTLQLEVEATQVTSFFVQARGPLHWGTTQRNDLSVPGPVIGFHTKQFPQVPNYGTAGFIFVADVANNTHYDVSVGYIQTAAGSMSVAYDGGKSATLFTMPALDGPFPSDDFLWYNNTSEFGHYVIPKNTSKSLVNSNQPTIFMSDSPAHRVEALSQPSDNSKWLNYILIDVELKTYLSVSNAKLPGQAWDFGGIPVGLSTSTWQVTGEADRVAPASSSADVLNLQNWNLVAQVPAQSETYPGNGQRDYLEWEDNAQSVLALFSNAKANLANAEVRSDHSGAIGLTLDTRGFTSEVAAYYPVYNTINT